MCYKVSITSLSEFDCCYCWLVLFIIMHNTMSKSSVFYLLYPSVATAVLFSVLPINLSLSPVSSQCLRPPPPHTPYMDFDYESACHFCNKFGQFLSLGHLTCGQFLSLGCLTCGQFLSLRPELDSPACCSRCRCKNPGWCSHYHSHRRPEGLCLGSALPSRASLPGSPPSSWAY